MKRLFLALPLCLAAQLAHAQCASEAQTFLSCTLERSGKSLSVCLEGDSAVYRFGPAGAPEITLSQPLITLDYRPWNGVGSSIWEEVRFQNEDVSYVVYGSILRIAADEADGPNLSGGVEVLRGDTRLAHIKCSPKAVQFPWTEAIGDAKRAAGLSRDRALQTWVKTPG